MMGLCSMYAPLLTRCWLCLSSGWCMQRSFGMQDGSGCSSSPMLLPSRGSLPANPDLQLTESLYIHLIRVEDCC